MAEVIGVVASVTQLVQLSGVLLAGGYGFLSKVARAPSEMRSLLTEAAALDSLLGQLQVIAESTPNVTAPSDPLMALDRLGVFGECKAALQTIQRSIKTCEQVHDKEVKNFGKRLLWPFKEKETKENLEKLHRLRGLLANAVEASSASALRRIEGNQNALMDDMRALSTNVQSQISHGEAKKVVSWICPATCDGAYSSLQSALSHRVAGTGTWFLQSDVFNKWKASKARTIWITGLPGSGKTLLFSTIVEHLRSVATATTAVLFFFCDHRDQSKVMVDDLLATFTKQMLDSSPACFERARQEYEDSSPHAFEKRKYLSLVMDMMSEFEEVLFVVDALDEASERDKIAAALVQLHKHGQDTAIPTKVLLTSRFDVQVESKYSSITSSRIALAENMREDIQRFIQNEVEGRVSNGSLKVRQRALLQLVQEQIRSRAGTVLQARLQLDYVSTAKSDRDIKAMLNSMPNGLDYTYQTLLCQAASHYSAQLHEIKVLLQCMVVAASPLTATQLSEIVTLQPRERFLDFDAVATDPYDALEMIAPLILTDNTKQREAVVKLSHYSLQEYLVSEEIKHSPAHYFHINMQEANAWLASICLQYLTFEVFDVSLRTKFTSQMLEMYAFRDYAASNWYIHLQDAKGLPGLLDRCQPYLDLFLDGSQGSRCYQRWQSLFFPHTEISHYSPICCAIWAGLDDVFDYLLPHIPHIDSHSLDGYTCLTVAAKHNKPTIIRKLLDAGADIEHPTAEPGLERKLTPLHLACEFGANEAVDMLLTAGANIHAQSASGSTPFYRACRSGDVRILKKLKNQGADVNALTHDNWTPLREAAMTHQTEVMELLQSWGALRHVTRA